MKVERVSFSERDKRIREQSYGDKPLLFKRSKSYREIRGS